MIKSSPEIKSGFSELINNGSTVHYIGYIKSPTCLTPDFNHNNKDRRSSSIEIHLRNLELLLIIILISSVLCQSSVYLSKSDLFNCPSVADSIPGSIHQLLFRLFTSRDRQSSVSPIYPWFTSFIQQMHKEGHFRRFSFNLMLAMYLNYDFGHLDRLLNDNLNYSPFVLPSSICDRLDNINWIPRKKLFVQSVNWVSLIDRSHHYNETHLPFKARQNHHPHCLSACPPCPCCWLVNFSCLWTIERWPAVSRSQLVMEP